MNEIPTLELQVIEHTYTTNSSTLKLIFSFFMVQFMCLASTHAQVIIKDNLFLRALIDYGVDTNDDRIIQLDEAETVTEEPGCSLEVW